VRDLEAGGQIEPHHLAGQQAEPVVPPPFEAGLEQQLQPHADAEERLVGADVRHDRFHETAVAERPHGVSERTHAGKHQPLRLRHHLGIVGDRGGRAELLEGLLHAPQVAAAVVDDRHHGAECSKRPGAGHFAATSTAARSG
jgi:hypothetical protein